MKYNLTALLSTKSVYKLWYPNEKAIYGWWCDKKCVCDSAAVVHSPRTRRFQMYAHTFSASFIIQKRKKKNE